MTGLIADKFPPSAGRDACRIETRHNAPEAAALVAPLSNDAVVQAVFFIPPRGCCMMFDARVPDLITVATRS